MYEYLVTALADKKMTLVGAHPYVVSEETTMNYTKLALAVMADKPQSIILFGLSSFAVPFFRVARSLPATNSDAGSATIATVSIMGDDLLNLLRSNRMDPTNFYQTTVVPSPTGTTTIATRYRAAMLAYNASATYDHTSFEGYIVGRFVAEAVQETDTLNASSFLTALYAVQMMDLDDVVFGPISRFCTSNESSSSETRSSLCYCNQGLRYVAVNRVTSNYTFAEESLFNYPITDCFAQDDDITRPIVFVGFTVTNSSVASYAMSLLNATIDDASQFSTYVENYTIDNMYQFNETTAKINSVGNRTLLLAAIGGLYIEPQEVYPVFPIFSQPVIPAQPFDSRTLFLLATLQQEMFVNAKHIARVRNSSLVYLLYSTFYSNVGLDVVTFVQDSLLTFQRSLNGAVSFSDAKTLQQQLNGMPEGSTLIVIGIETEEQMSILVAALTKNELLTAYLPFNDIMLYWDILQPHDHCETVPRRVIFSTNLPNWLDSSSSTFVANYLSLSTSYDSDNPLTMVGYLIGRFTDYIIARTGDNFDPDSFVTTVYNTMYVALEDLSLGMFEDVQCSDSNCLCNVGPRLVRTYRISTIFDLGEAETFVRFANCAVEYVLPAAKGVNIALVATLCTVVPLIVCGLLAYLIIHFCFGGRDNSAAPKKEAIPLIVLFVDLDYGTALWGRYPSQMVKAVEDHHKIIRSCVRKHSLYEVKTIGDSFMIVTNSPDDAIRFALDVQEQLVKHDWGTKVFDELYQQSTVVNTQRASVKSPGTPSPLVPYTNELWNGLRVRIGINFGRGEIRFDETTQGYDYYGPVVNEAARIESVANGGQIVVSNAVVAASSVDTTLYTLKDLGLQSLRGVDHPLSLVQLLPTSLCGRKFPPLRLDAMYTAQSHEQGTASETSSSHNLEKKGTVTQSVQESSHNSSSLSRGVEGALQDAAARHSLVVAGLVPHIYMSGEFTRFKCVLESMFAPTGLSFREEALTNLCKNWRVHEPKSLADKVALELTLVRLVSRVAETPAVLETIRTINLSCPSEGHVPESTRSPHISVEGFSGACGDSVTDEKFKTPTTV